VCASVGGGEHLAEGPDCWPRRHSGRRTRLLSRHIGLLHERTNRARASENLRVPREIFPIHVPSELGGYLGLWHEHDLRVDLVGVRLRLEKPGKRVSTGPGIARRRGSGRARRGIGSEKPGEGKKKRREEEGTLSSTLSTRQSNLEGRS